MCFDKERLFRGCLRPPTISMLNGDKNALKRKILPILCGIVPYGPSKNTSRPHIHSQRAR